VKKIQPGLHYYFRSDFGAKVQKCQAGYSCWFASHCSAISFSDLNLNSRYSYRSLCSNRLTRLDLMASLIEVALRFHFVTRRTVAGSASVFASFVGIVAVVVGVVAVDVRIVDFGVVAVVVAAVAASVFADFVGSGYFANFGGFVDSVAAIVSCLGIRAGDSLSSSNGSNYGSNFGYSSGSSSDSLSDSSSGSAMDSTMGSTMGSTKDSTMDSAKNAAKGCYSSNSISNWLTVGALVSTKFGIVDSLNGVGQNEYFHR